MLPGTSSAPSPLDDVTQIDGAVREILQTIGMAETPAAVMVGHLTTPLSPL